MYPKYSTLYNELSESQSPYVVLKENSTTFKTVLPISYFWLKRNNRMDILQDISQNLSKTQYKDMNNKKDFLERKSLYEKKFGEIYDRFPVTEQNKNSLDDLSIFLEHYMFNLNSYSELERIEKSITKHDLNDENYVNALGPLLSFLTKEKKEELLNDRLKILFLKKTIFFEKYIF